MDTNSNTRESIVHKSNGLTIVKELLGEPAFAKHKESLLRELCKLPVNEGFSTLNDLLQSGFIDVNDLSLWTAELLHTHNKASHQGAPSNGNQTTPSPINVSGGIERGAQSQQATGSGGLALGLGFSESPSSNAYAALSGMESKATGGQGYVHYTSSQINDMLDSFYLAIDRDKDELFAENLYRKISSEPTSRSQLPFMTSSLFTLYQAKQQHHKIIAIVEQARRNSINVSSDMVAQTLYIYFKSNNWEFRQLKQSLAKATNLFNDAISDAMYSNEEKFVLFLAMMKIHAKICSRQDVRQVPGGTDFPSQAILFYEFHSRRAGSFFQSATQKQLLEVYSCLTHCREVMDMREISLAEQTQRELMLAQANHMRAEQQQQQHSHTNSNSMHALNNRRQEEMAGLGMLFHDPNNQTNPSGSHNGNGNAKYYPNQLAPQSRDQQRERELALMEREREMKKLLAQGLSPASLNRSGQNTPQQQSKLAGQSPHLKQDPALAGLGLSLGGGASLTRSGGIGLNSSGGAALDGSYLPMGIPMGLTDRNALNEERHSATKDLDLVDPLGLGLENNGDDEPQAKLCYFYPRVPCKNGENCRFVHSDLPRRKNRKKDASAANPLAANSLSLSPGTSLTREQQQLQLLASALAHQQGSNTHSPSSLGSLSPLSPAFSSQQAKERDLQLAQLHQQLQLQQQLSAGLNPNAPNHVPSGLGALSPLSPAFVASSKDRGLHHSSDALRDERDRLERMERLGGVSPASGVQQGSGLGTLSPLSPVFVSSNLSGVSSSAITIPSSRDRDARDLGAANPSNASNSSSLSDREAGSLSPLSPAFVLASSPTAISPTQLSKEQHLRANYYASESLLDPTSQQQLPGQLRDGAHERIEQEMSPSSPPSHGLDSPTKPANPSEVNATDVSENGKTEGDEPQQSGSARANDDAAGEQLASPEQQQATDKPSEQPVESWKQPVRLNQSNSELSASPEDPHREPVRQGASPDAPSSTSPPTHAPLPQQLPIPIPQPRANSLVSGSMLSLNGGNLLSHHAQRSVSASPTPNSPSDLGLHVSRSETGHANNSPHHHLPRDVRDIRDVRDVREFRDIRDIRDVREMPPRDVRDVRDANNQLPPHLRDIRDVRDIRDIRDFQRGGEREVRGELRDIRDIRDAQWLDIRDFRDLRDMSEQQQQQIQQQQQLLRERERSELQSSHSRAEDANSLLVAAMQDAQSRSAERESLLHSRGQDVHRHSGDVKLETGLTGSAFTPSGERVFGNPLIAPHMSNYMLSLNSQNTASANLGVNPPHSSLLSHSHATGLGAFDGSGGLSALQQQQSMQPPHQPRAQSPINVLGLSGLSLSGQTGLGLGVGLNSSSGARDSLVAPQNANLNNNLNTLNNLNNPAVNNAGANGAIPPSFLSYLSYQAQMGQNRLK